MLLLPERHKAEMILQSMGNYAEVIGKGKMKKCGTLNSNARKNLIYFFNESIQNAFHLAEQTCSWKYGQLYLSSPRWSRVSNDGYFMIIVSPLFSLFPSAYCFHFGQMCYTGLFSFYTAIQYSAGSYVDLFVVTLFLGFMGAVSLCFSTPDVVNKQDSKVSASFSLLINSKSVDSAGHLKCKITCRSFHVTLHFLSWHVIEDFKEFFSNQYTDTGSAISLFRRKPDQNRKNSQTHLLHCLW